MEELIKNINNMNENTKSYYYFLVADYSYPTLVYRNWQVFELGRNLSLYKPIILPKDYQVIDLYLRKKISKPKMADYHIYDGTEHIISKRMKESIEEMDPVNIHFLPAVIHTGKEEKEDYADYFIINCYNVIQAMDKENSVWKKSRNTMPGREVLSIGKLVMDMDKIKDIPLSERLIFALGECRSYTLFHESVVENIEKLSPKGCYAIPVEDWYDDLMMDL
jgi:hypothetical protein